MPASQTEYEIDAIIPATGWKARFHGPDGFHEEAPLICWTLCNFEDQHDENAKEVMGLALRHGKRILCDCDDDFIEYVAPRL
mgnify:CR=1 FL=1